MMIAQNMKILLERPNDARAFANAIMGLEKVTESPSVEDLINLLPEEDRQVVSIGLILGV